MTARTAVGNLLHDATAPAFGERFDTLLQHRQLVVERIVSSDHLTPHRYEQPQDEWVLLVSGEAELTVHDEWLRLRAGDHVFLPAGTPHRVEKATSGAIWLAVHLHPDAGPLATAPSTSPESHP